MKVFPILFVIMLLPLLISPQNTTSKSSVRHKKLFGHGQSCSTDSNCEPGLNCIFHICLTSYEVKNYKALGLTTKDICDTEKNKCPSGKVCLNYHCENIKSNEENSTNKTETDIHLIMAGNLYSKKKVVLSGKESEVSYNYSRFFRKIKKDIKHADISIVNPEIIFGSEYFGINNKKNDYVSPDALGNALIKAGFKLILQTNDHINDKGSKGIELTLNYWKSKYPKIKLLGITEKKNEGELPYYIYEKNDTKIGIISYTTFLRKALDKNSTYKINILNNKNEKKIIEDLKELKSKTDFVIACVHWGEKTTNMPNKYQIQWAKFLSDHDVDLILGSHPGYVQPISYVEGKNGKKTLVYFSLGDLISTSKKEKNSLGALASVIITKKNGKTYISSHRVIPLVTIADKNAINYESVKLSEYSSIVKNMENAVGKKKQKSLKKLGKYDILCHKVFGYFC